ncbi:MAG: response regulator [Anaerolineae bacterium]|nr:response regulator [Anaerolineae bacterium]
MNMVKALIIDDNQSNINVLGALLQHEGIAYAEVLYPTEIENTVASEGPFNVVFLDLEFPTNNGFSIIEKLRQMDGLDGVPIVAYSVHISEIEQARRAGFDGFLGKPLDADCFSDQLRRILNGEQVWEIIS